MSASGVSVVPSPGGLMSSNGGGSHWIDQQQQLRHLPSSSLTAILSSGGGGSTGSRLPRGSLPESASPRATWQQHQQQMRQGLLGGHSSTPPQTRKRQHMEEPRMCSDTSSDDDGRFGDFTHRGLWCTHRVTACKYLSAKINYPQCCSIPLITDPTVHALSAKLRCWTSPILTFSTCTV